MTPATPTTAGRSRIAALDVLRGIAMVLMVLDHARDFFFGMTRVVPTDLAVTTPALFATRWVTHFCAPVFVFLAGTSAWLYRTRHSPAEATRFLLGRGLFLVLLEVTVIRLCWIPDPTYSFTLVQVIWALGWSMMMLGLASRLPRGAVVALGAAIVLGHNLLDSVHAADLGVPPWAWAFVHERATIEPFPGKKVFFSYPVLPWFGVMALGYAFGAVVQTEPAARVARTRRIGLALTLLFFAVRGINAYGDPAPWSVQATPLLTAMSFLNCEKYPPSLAYLLMTMGPALLLLSVLDTPRPPGRIRSALAVLGGVPLFFYIAHLVLLRYTSLPLAYLRFGAAAFEPPPGHAGSPDYDLGVTWLAWILAVIVLYPLAARFQRRKELRPESWLRYF